MINEKEMTDKEIALATLKTECIKIAAKYSFSYDDILKQSKELIGLIVFSDDIQGRRVSSLSMHD